MAVALAALDAVVVVQGADGDAADPADASFYRLPGDRPDRDTDLAHGDLSPRSSCPRRRRGAASAYRKVRDRASYAFALVSVAAALTIVDGRCRTVRVALGGVAHRAWRATLAEAVLVGGRRPTEAAFAAAGTPSSVPAQPLPGNAFKVALAHRRGLAIAAALTRRGAPSPDDRSSTDG